MGLFSKKEEIPKIPPAPALATFPTKVSEKKDLPELPSFPPNSNNENLNQEMVKSAVIETDSPGEEEESLEEDKPLPAEENLILTSNEIESPTLPSVPISSPVKKEVASIFVRVDKFQSAQKHFEEIKSKVKEIESTLGKIKDVKLKEDEELASWSTEIEKLKLKLSEIDSDIFSQI